MSRNCFRIEHSAPCPQSAFPSCWDIARRTGHEPKRLQRREFRPFFDTFRLSYLAGCQIVCCHSDRKCAEPATNRWNNYDCVGKFTKRELSKIQLLAAIQPIFDAQGHGYSPFFTAPASRPPTMRPNGHCVQRWLRGKPGVATAPKTVRRLNRC